MKLGAVADRVRDALQRADRDSPSPDDVGDPDAPDADEGEVADRGAADGDEADATERNATGDRGIRDRLPAVTRRRLLGAGLGIGAAKAVDNVLIGYGVLTGTNLLAQDVEALATEHMRAFPFETTVDGVALAQDRGVLRVWTGDGTGASETDRETDSAGETRAGEPTAAYGIGSLTAADGRAADREHELAAGRDRGPIEELAADWHAITADPAAVDVRPSRTDAFFETIATEDTRPFTVGALRGAGFDPAPPATVAEHVDADPGDPASIVYGLEPFFETGSYDVHRYAAGSLEDNVLMGAVDVRQHFESPTSFDAIASGANDGLFCYEFVFRSIDALHAVAAHRQTAPVVAAVVTDTRHKHVYTALASAYRDDAGDLVVPITFVDYTHTTLYDDYAADVVLGDGLEAYNARHRATAIYWHDYVGGL